MANEEGDGILAKKRKLNDSSDDGAEMQSGENLQEQLRQFDVLDEIQGDESGSEASDGGFLLIFM